MGLTAFPETVETEICPDVEWLGTAVEIDVDVAELKIAKLPLKSVRSFAMAVSKFVPLIVTAVPAKPIAGENPVIDGAFEEVTWNEPLLVALPAGAVTLIVPEVAPPGTDTTNWVIVADVTVADVPLKLTVFWLGTVLKEVPFMVTVVPTGPLVGTNPMIETCEDGFREMERRFPTAS